MEYQSFMITLGIVLVMGLIFYTKIIKGTIVEDAFKGLFRWIIGRKKKGDKKTEIKYESEIADIINAIGDKYDILQYTVHKKDGTITLKLKKKE